MKNEEFLRERIFFFISTKLKFPDLFLKETG